MVTASLPFPPRSARATRGKALRGTSTAGAAIGSVLGSIVAIAVAALGLLVVPVAALVIFGPAIIDLLL